MGNCAAQLHCFNSYGRVAKLNECLQTIPKDRPSRLPSPSAEVNTLKRAVDGVYPHFGGVSVASSQVLRRIRLIFQSAQPALAALRFCLPAPAPLQLSHLEGEALADSAGPPSESLKRPT
jgi:hypothetical protein